MADPTKVLFVCTGNSARGQMAEGFARHYSAGRVEAHSAGMEPSHLNPNAVAVMRERAVDISHQEFKAVGQHVARSMDLVITVCGNEDERCPVLPPEVRRLHGPLHDPGRARGTAEEVLAVFRRSRGENDAVVRGFIADVTPQETGP